MEFKEPFFKNERNEFKLSRNRDKVLDQKEVDDGTWAIPWMHRNRNLRRLRNSKAGMG